MLLTFGELSVEALHNRKYAKYKAAYIHNCLKNGETPVPGPLVADENEEGDDNEDVVVGGGNTTGAGEGFNEVSTGSGANSNVQPSSLPQSPLIEFKPHPVAYNRKFSFLFVSVLFS